MKMMIFYDDNDPDYGACSFLDKYSCVQVYNDMVSKGLSELTLEDDENCFTIELYDFDIDLTPDLEKLIMILKDDFMDYDHLKGIDFVLMGD